MSVVMPVYNGARYIVEAIESVLGQTHEHFEFIIVDDGSTDATHEIVAAYAQRDGRIRLVSQPNRGQAASLNRALAMAGGEWVAILDHDDVCLPKRLERQLRAVAANPEVRVLGSWAYAIDASGRRIDLMKWGPTTVEEFERLKADEALVIPVHPSVMLHRQTILTLGGYDEAFGAAADAELWSRVSDHHLILVLPEPLVCYRMHLRSMSFTRFFEQVWMMRWMAARQSARRRGLPEPSKAGFARTERGLERLRRVREDRRDFYLKLCWTAKLEGRNLRRVLLLTVALLLDPRGIAPRLHTRVERLRRLYARPRRKASSRAPQ